MFSIEVGTLVSWISMLYLNLFWYHVKSVFWGNRTTNQKSGVLLLTNERTEKLRITKIERLSRFFIKFNNASMDIEISWSEFCVSNTKVPSSEVKTVVQLIPWLSTKQLSVTFSYWISRGLHPFREKYNWGKVLNLKFKSCFML